MTPQLPDTFELTPPDYGAALRAYRKDTLTFGSRQRVKRVAEPPRLPQQHRYCTLHPTRWLRGARSTAAEPCWECQMTGGSERFDKAAFEHLDRLIALGLGELSQERITPEMIAARELLLKIPSIEL